MGNIDLSRVLNNHHVKVSENIHESSIFDNQRLSEINDTREVKQDNHNESGELKNQKFLNIDEILKV